jgi:hypothetical protein
MTAIPDDKTVAPVKSKSRLYRDFKCPIYGIATRFPDLPSAALIDAIQ